MVSKIAVVMCIGILLASIFTVSAAYFILSNVVTVDVGGFGFALSFDQPILGTIDLIANLSKNGEPITGVSIMFYNMTVGSVVLGTNTTVSGVATWRITNVSNGTKLYQAEYSVP